MRRRGSFSHRAFGKAWLLAAAAALVAVGPVGQLSSAAAQSAEAADAKVVARALEHQRVLAQWYRAVPGRPRAFALSDPVAR